MTVALLFPGQGAQHPHMLDALPDTPGARRAVAEARHTLSSLAVTADLDLPGRDTVAGQLALVTAGVACGRALVEDGGLRVGFVAGHSVGAFAAAVVAGVLRFSDALAAVHRRAVSMAAVCRDGDWGMGAALGLTPSAAAGLAEATSTAEDPVWVANINSATQTVLAGTGTGLARLEDGARRVGARGFERLEVDIASHGALQEPTAQVLDEYFRGIPAAAPTMKYITNAGGRSVGTSAAVVDDLIRSVARTVRWYDGTRLMAELGVTCTVEVIPGHTLTRLVAATEPAITALALSEVGFGNVVARASR